MILSIQNITKSYGDNTVLKNINFQMEAGEKIALIGINGAGKTTLLKIIIGEETPDSGNVIFSKDVSFGYLSQHQDISFDNTIYQEMLDTKKDIINMKERIRSIEHEMTDKSGAELDKLLEEYNKLQTIFDRENGYAYESEITGVLKGLGFTEEDYSRNINTLSGGQKMRIALGRLLLERPDILILDEPTNHLDTDSVTWLEGFLSSYSGAVIVVSHDRYFIDRVSNKIVEIDQGVSAVYKGSYSFYATERAKIREAKLKAYLNQQKEIKHQEEVITKLKEFNREKSIKRAESREKMLSKIDRLEKPTEQRADMRLSLTPVTESGEDVLYVFGDILLKNAEEIVEKYPLPENLSFAPRTLDEYTRNSMLEKITSKLDSTGYKVAEFISSENKKGKPSKAVQKVMDVFPVTPLLAIQLVLLAVIIWLVSTVSITLVNKDDNELNEASVYESVDLQNKYVAVLDYYPLNVDYVVTAEVSPDDPDASAYETETAEETYDPLAPVIAETDPVEPSATRG